MRTREASDLLKNQIIDLYEKHNGVHAQIAKELNITREYVRQVCSTIGLKALGKHKSKFNVTLAQTLANEGNSFKEISTKLNLSHRYCLAKLRKHGIKPKVTKLSDCTTEFLIDAYNKSESNYQEMAHNLNVHLESIRRCLRQRNLLTIIPNKRRTYDRPQKSESY